VKKTFTYVLFFLLFCGEIHSTHIVGGEIFYDRINDSVYKVTVKVYRDCFNGLAPFAGVNDGFSTFIPAILTVYTADSILVDTFDIGAPVITSVPPSINNPCIQPPGGVCVEEGVYTYTITLTPKLGGYYLVHQAIFRNNTVLNLLNPNAQGATYYTFIPGPEITITNSSPRYNNFPPIFICNNVTFTFDHKATDPDGDQLVYSICSPYDAQSFGQAPPPPYTPVTYVSPYSGSYPIAASPAFSINPTTGVLTGKPNLLGQYVVGICVQEFRGNTLINTHYRDFQFNVVACIVNIVSAIANQKSQCEGSTITFTNSTVTNISGLTYHWDFGVPSLLNDTSNIKNPTYTYQDTGRYEVLLIANPGKPCSDTIKQTVYVYPKLEINFPPLLKQCFRGNSFNFSAQGVHVPYATFNWDFTSKATPNSSTLKNPTNIAYSEPGKYFVKLIAKQFACTDTFIDSIRVVAPPIARINNLPTTWCDPAQMAFSNGSTSDLPVTYQWLFSNGTTSTAYEPIQIFSPPGIYSATLIVKTAAVCVDTSIASVKNITVNPTPRAGFTFSPQPTTIFDPKITFIDSSSTDVIKWQYSFGDGSGSSYSSDEHIYQEYGDYKATQLVTNSFNCTDTISHIVKILPEFRFWVPNTFSPDGNSLNENFMPITMGVSEYKFEVFSRWGELVFSTQEPKESWDGLHKGKECQQDVYAWRVGFRNVVSNYREIHYGHVLLLKNK